MTLRWAMVEVQVAALRGDDMDDFAFAETKAPGPGRDAAEVALILEKAGHSRNHALDCVTRDDEVLRWVRRDMVKRLWHSLPLEVAMNHQERRWLLHEVVEQLEPEAHSAAVLDHVRVCHLLDLSLMRIYVDLEHLVANGYLSRDRRTGPNGGRATFYWETTGKLLVEPVRPRPKTDSDAAPLHHDIPHLPAANADMQSTRPEAALLTGQNKRTMHLEFAHSG